MTHLDDFDRVLAEFLGDGPSVAPEPPVIAALAHARAVPRRRDPFGALRRDVMAQPLTVGGLRPGLVLAWAALVIAAVGIAIVGAGRSVDTVPAPSGAPIAPSAVTPPSPSASPVETPHQSAGPAVTATPLPRTTTLPPLGPPSVSPIHVALDQCCGDGLSVDVVDESGHLVRAVSGPNVEGGSVEVATVTNDDGRTLRLTWPGSPCDTVHRLTIDPAATTFTIDRPQCAGDSVPADRILVLAFDVDVDAAAVRADLVTARGGVGLPTWTASAIDKEGGLVRVSLLDGSQSVAGLEAVDVSETAGIGADVQLSEEAPDLIKLLWNGCGGEPALVIDATGREWTIVDSAGPCESTTIRGVELRLTGSLGVADIRVSEATSIP